ncbi:MAG: glycosyltransferase family 39 protein [Candidatus Promineifilaceae bacterium]|nr:glycosyltransferase family 39 protein [Candidatus Promineifilaceae bacterium]
MTTKETREGAAKSRGGVLDLLLVTLLGLPLIAPLLRWTSVPCTHDGHLHYHRVAAIRHAWENGIYFSRWLPDLAFGYGYPFFLYREPLPLYLTHWLHLAGMPLPAASNLFYIFCILAAGWFTYLWVRDVFGPRAGVVAAVAYMAAPYVLVDALVRGNQVESMALALMPLLLWAGRRFLVRGTAKWFLITLLGVAALALSHNISLFLFAPAFGVYLLAMGWLHEVWPRRLLGRLLLLFGLGLGVTSFYTGSAVLEMDEVTLSLSTTARDNNFRFNFTSPEELLAPVAAEDPALINPPLPFRVGWVPAALALLGVLSLAWNRQREQRAHVVLMAAGAAVYLFFALPISEPLWEIIPLIEFVQFPWRMVGRAALPLAVLAGAPFAALSGASMGRAFRPAARARWAGRLLPGAFLVAVALLMIEAFPLLYPSACRERAFPTIMDVHAYEAETGMVGVDPVGSYFPATVERRPDGSPLLEDYAAGRRPQRFDERALPPGAEVVSAEYGTNEARVVVDSPAGFRARYLTFAFPGWRASVDGERTPITPSDPEGLITFAVPAGRHTVRVAWSLTPLRGFLAGVSVLALVGIVAAGYVLSGGAGQVRRGPGGSEDPPSSRQDGGGETRSEDPVSSGMASSLSKRGRLLLLGLGVLMLGGKVLVVDRVETPLRRTAPPPVTYETAISAGGLRLAGYNLSRTMVPAGETFDVHLAWRVEATPAAAYQSNVWLSGPEGLTWSDRETHRPRLYEDAPETTAWAPGRWAWDSREVQVLPGTPPGRYEIVLTLFEREGLQPLTLVDEEGALGPTAVIGEIEVGRPERPPSPTPQHPLRAPVAGLTLLGYNQDRAEAAPGDPLLLTLFWENERGSGEGAARQIALQLRYEGGGVAHEWTIPPVREDYPPSAWEEGARLRGQHLLRLPARLESGAYRLWLEGTALGTIRIEAPPRSFTPPPYETGVNATFGGRAELAGYSLAPEVSLGTAGASLPPSLTVRLVWQSLLDMPTSYRVFVHLVDGTGGIVAQSDAEPAGWTRPTTGWAPGEYVVDEHVLTPPEEGVTGPFSLRVGLYDPATGERLATGDGDFVTLEP